MGVEAGVFWGGGGDGGATVVLAGEEAEEFCRLCRTCLRLSSALTATRCKRQKSRNSENFIKERLGSKAKADKKMGMFEREDRATTMIGGKKPGNSAF